MKAQQKYTVSEATYFLGFKSRSTINKRTKSGGKDSISYEIDDHGNKIISALELERAFPDKYKMALRKIQNTGKEYSTKAQLNTEKNTKDTSILSARIEMLEEQIAYERQERERERIEAKTQTQKHEEREKVTQEQMKKLLDTVERQTFLISDMREKTPEKPAEGNKKLFGWFRTKNS